MSLPTHLSYVFAHAPSHAVSPVYATDRYQNQCYRIIKVIAPDFLRRTGSRLTWEYKLWWMHLIARGGDLSQNIKQLDAGYGHGRRSAFSSSQDAFSV